MFSTSMIASSTTSPTAIARPASTIVLMLIFICIRTMTALTIDSGIAVRLMTAVRHSNRNAIKMRLTRMQPRIMAKRRLARAISMKVAGRKMRAVTLTPGMLGLSASMAFSTSRVTSRVLAQGNFSTTTKSPASSWITPSPMNGLLPTFKSAT